MAERQAKTNTRPENKKERREREKQRKKQRGGKERQREKVVTKELGWSLSVQHSKHQLSQF